MEIFYRKEPREKVISQKGGFLNILRSLMTASLPLMENVLTPLAKNVLVPLGLSWVSSSKDIAIQRNIFGSGITVVFLNEEICHIFKNS